MGIDVLDTGNGSATHAFHTHGSHPVNAGLRCSESMIQGVGGATIGLATAATAATAVPPSSTAFEFVESKANDLVCLTALWTLEIGAGGTYGVQCW
jgi:hypothetical protein